MTMTMIFSQSRGDSCVARSLVPDPKRGMAQYGSDEDVGWVDGNHTNTIRVQDQGHYLNYSVSVIPDPVAVAWGTKGGLKQLVEASRNGDDGIGPLYRV